MFSCTQNQKKDSIYFFGTFDEAIEVAKEENKLLFLDFYTVWCGGCKSYDRFVFSDSTVQEYLEADFIFKSVDAEKGEGIELKNKFGVAGYPTLIIADQEGGEIGRIVGFELAFMDSTNLFIEQVEKVASGVGTLQSMEKEYEKDPVNIELMYDLIEAYKDHGKYQDIENLANIMIQSEDSLVQIDGHFYFALSWIYRKENANPEKMKHFLASKVNPANDKYFLALDYLLNFYKRRNVTDSITYFYEVIVKSDPNAWYEKKQYAQFLFENNINIERAKDLAIEYNSLPYPFTEDYKQPLLMAYVNAYDSNTDISMVQYDEWMEDFTARYNIDDTYWAHHYYADFANRFKVNLDQALVYITIAEEHNGRVTEAKEMLHEALAIVNSESQYEHITKLLEQY